MHVTFTLIAAGAVSALMAVTLVPPEVSAQSRGYKQVERGIGYRVLPGARYLSGKRYRKTAVRGESDRVGGFSYNFRQSLDYDVLPPSPDDFGPNLDNSPVVTDGPISQDAYP